MKKVMFSVLVVLLALSLWLAPATAQEWTQVSHTKPSSRSAIQHIAFVSDTVVICAAGPNLYRGSISSNGQVQWQSTSVGTNIYGIAVPVDDPFYVAYIKKDKSVGMRYTRDLGWRGGFTPTIGNTWLRDIAASADGKYLAIAHDRIGRSNYSWVSVYNARTQDAVFGGRHRLEKRDVLSVALHTDARHMFVADGDNNTDEWSLPAWRITEVYTSGARVRSVAYEGGYIASGREDGKIDISDYINEKHIRRLHLPNREPVTSVSFDRHKKFIVARAGSNYGGYVFRVSDGKLLKEFGLTFAIAISPGGNLIATSNPPGTSLRIWRKGPDPAQQDLATIALNESKSKLNSATLIKGLKIDKSRMSQLVYRDTGVVEDSFFYWGDNQFLVLDQGNMPTCGTTSAEMVLHYYGVDKGQGTIWIEGGVHNVEAGSFPGELKRALNELGVPAKWYHRLTLDHLKSYVRQNRPPIILLRFGDFLHYVVVVGYNNDGDFLIADPNNCFRWITSSDLKKGWSLDEPGIDPNRYQPRNLFESFGLKTLTPLVDVLTGGENGIVPVNPPTQHFRPNWSELRAIEVTGSHRFNPTFSSENWERTLDFTYNFQDYRVSRVKPASVSNAFGLEDAWLKGHRKIASDKVKIWGGIAYGKVTRGKLWVWVRAYRRNKGGLVAAAPAADPLNVLPTETSLSSNYPNPFNPETWIPYQLAKPAEVTVSIHSVDGKLVRTLELGHMPAGVYHSKSRAAYWDGRNAQGERVASGVYFYTFKAGDFSATQKMVIMK